MSAINRKAVALLSGGLDSTLAAKLLLDQGIELEGVFFSMLWGCCDKLQALKAAHRLGMPLMVLKIQEDYIDLIRKPKYGYGVQMNPCVDCRIHMWTRAKRYMDSVGATFLVTGEVVGQRPMSQMRPRLDLIERESGLVGRIVRPLSAQLLPPTLPEQAGIVDRERLLAIAGRSRKDQIALAAQLGITDYATPAGGCELTDPVFATKVKDLLAHEEHPTTNDMELLTIGRHFRLTPTVKVLLGRNAEENLLLEGYHSTATTLFKPLFPGPSALVVGPWREELRDQVLQLIARYTKFEKLDGQEALVQCGTDVWPVTPAHGTQHLPAGQAGTAHSIAHT